MFYEIKIDDKIYKSNKVIKDGSAWTYIICNVKNSKTETPKILLTAGDVSIRISSKLTIADEFVRKMLDSFDAYVDLNECMVYMIKSTSETGYIPDKYSYIQNLKRRILIWDNIPEMYDVENVLAYKIAVSDFIASEEDFALCTNEYLYKYYADQMILNSSTSIDDFTQLINATLGLDETAKYLQLINSAMEV